VFAFLKVIPNVADPLISEDREEKREEERSKMADSKVVTLRTLNFMTNRLLSRRQFVSPLDPIGF
jgi:hypothetical protein